MSKYQIMKGQLEGCEIENASLRAQLAELKAEIGRWRDDHIEQERTIEGLSKQLAESQKRVNELKEFIQRHREGLSVYLSDVESPDGTHFMCLDMDRMDALLQKGKDNEQS